MYQKVKLVGNSKTRKLYVEYSEIDAQQLKFYVKKNHPLFGSVENTLDER